ncbi:MAG: hypothetical protein J2P43_06790 [Candidatus Dormibacteraeota bacterium]|nr:hypothetical protein [Candidatus Dormibacteraeota bacterium]
MISIGLDLGIAALLVFGVVYGVGSVVGHPLTPALMLFSGPDLAVWIYTVILFFAVRAVVRTVGVLTTRGGSWG